MIAAKLFGLTFLAVICLTIGEDVPVLGGASELSGHRLKEAVDRLHTAMSKLTTGDAPTYEVVNVSKVTHQVVAGLLYTYTVDLKQGSDTKQCTVKLWSRDWLSEGGQNLNVQCGGDEVVETTW